MMKTNTTTETNAIALVTAAVIALLASLLFVAPFFQAADAAEMLDADQKGSLTISPQSADGKAVSGTFEIFKVATAAADGNGWHFQWAKGYEGTDHALGTQTGDLSDSYRNQLVSLLKDKVDARKPTQKSQSASKTTTFSDLSVGLYYVRMTGVQSGYDTISPFLVSIPTAGSDGSLIYNVTANSKAGRAQKESGGTSGSTSTTSTKTPSGSSGSSPTETLPQTGQLWWPVFVLIAAGAVLVLAGVVRRRSGKNDVSR